MMMKIALVSQEYFPEKARGGIGTQTFIKAQGLAKLGHQVFIIARLFADENNLCLARALPKAGLGARLP